MSTRYSPRWFTNPSPSNTFPCSKFGATGLFSKSHESSTHRRLVGSPCFVLKCMLFFVSAFLFPPFEIVNQLTDWNETLYSHYTTGAHTGNYRNFSRSTTRNKNKMKWVETTQNLHSAQREIKQQPLLYFVVSFIFWYTDLHKFAGALKCCLT